MKSDHIIIRGARQHNLKNINVEIPRGKLVIITGLSGSGKSTLAFDTLYAEGQRRYVESLSSYARQFLERMDKPDVDSIEGLSPAIAIEQKTAGHNPRSTVGTVTEIYDYLRLLYARIGMPHCHQCGRPITSQSIDQITDQIKTLPENTRILILSPLVTAQKGAHEKLLARLRKDGFARVRINGDIKELETLSGLPKTKKHTIDVVVDRLVIHDGIGNRLADSLEIALSLSNGVAIVDVVGGESLLFSEKAACVTCHVSYPELTPAGFSFNSPQGACPTCDGLGALSVFSPERIVPNPMLSLREGAVVHWANRNSVYFSEFLDAITAFYNVDIYTPFKDLPESFKNVLFHGSGDTLIPFYFERKGKRYTYHKPYEGIIPNLHRRYMETDSHPMREEIKQFMMFKPCHDCQGQRLNIAARHVRVGGKTIAELTALSVDQSFQFFKTLSLGPKQTMIAERLLKEISERLLFLRNVGLDYLTIDRTAATLSGGESQRIRLATQIGSKLTGVLYVLDEPSIGLHQKDNQRLLSTLKQMRDIGNTVLVVEHDEDTIRASDYVIDMGPAAGIHGGEVVFAGPPANLLQDDNSLTGQYLSGKKTIPIPQTRRTGNGYRLTLSGASVNNLKDITVSFPLGVFICVTGVSGSGKSSLILETLYPVLAQKRHYSSTAPGCLKAIAGHERVDKVINITQAPIGRTPRSNPGTYTNVFTHIRDMFARTPDSKARGYKPGRFSFNVKGGRCEACQGDGIIKIEMHFLPDVYVGCDVCNGNRYNRETLDVRYKGKNIADVLNMTIHQALDFFSKISSIRLKLQTLADVGIGYIRLGQPATTLSGGEAQRIKLAKELSRRSTGRTVYILDEPTTGLHMDDIKKLLDVLNRLVDAGNTVIVIEHNLDVVKSADHIIDMGPEGGDRGGTIVAQGTPETIIQIKKSYTGAYLKQVLKRER